MRAEKIAVLALAFAGAMPNGAHADPQADFKSATLNGYIAECSAYSVQLCEFDLGKYVRARWTDRHGPNAEETCTARAGNQRLSDSDLGRTIWSWLTAHRELGSRAAAEVFVSAVEAEYPCVDEAIERPRAAVQSFASPDEQKPQLQTSPISSPH